MAVEPKHAGTYTFTVSNKVGSVEGSTKLVVRAEDEECASSPRVESNPVTREKFGEYVSSCHAQNNGGFVVQFQVTVQYIHLCMSTEWCSLVSEFALWGGRPPDHCW